MFLWDISTLLEYIPAVSGHLIMVGDFNVQQIGKAVPWHSGFRTHNQSAYFIRSTCMWHKYCHRSTIWPPCCFVHSQFCSPWYNQEMYFMQKASLWPESISSRYQLSHVLVSGFYIVHLILLISITLSYVSSLTSMHLRRSHSLLSDLMPVGIQRTFEMPSKLDAVLSVRWSNLDSRSTENYTKINAKPTATSYPYPYPNLIIWCETTFQVSEQALIPSIKTSFTWTWFRWWPSWWFWHSPWTEI